MYFTSDQQHMKFVLFFVGFLFSVPAFSQDITGVWIGFLETNGTRLPYELAISRNDEKFSGYSLTTFTIEGVENKGLKSMKIKNRNGKITIEDDDLIQDNYSTNPKRVMLWSSLSLVKSDTGSVLTGLFNTRAYNKPGYKGIIHLRKGRNHREGELMARLEKLDLLYTLSFLPPAVSVKKNEEVVAKTAPPVQVEKPLEEARLNKPLNESKKQDPPRQQGLPVVENRIIRPAAAIPAAELSKRKTEPIQTIYYRTDSLLLSLYDNGQVDGDTVSVVWDGNTIIAKEGLTTRPITRKIYITPDLGDSVQLIMYAENLGLIPPNTGLLIVEDGNQRHEVRFSGDLQRNSAVIFRRRR
jgi:hypothetical protein